MIVPAEQRDELLVGHEGVFDYHLEAVALNFAGSDECGLKRR